jgi:hypothetical protein
MNTTNDLLWTWDMIEVLQTDLGAQYPKLKIMKTRVLKDIFLVESNGTYKFQLDFSEQDVVIFDHIMDITEFMNLNKFNIQNQEADFSGRIVIPRIILIMKYIAPDQHEFEKQYKTSAEIKSIFPQCKILCLFRYKGKYNEKKVEKSMNSYDKILYFSNEKPAIDSVYKKGDLKRSGQGVLKKSYDVLISCLSETLKNEELKFMS